MIWIRGLRSTLSREDYGSVLDPAVKRCFLHITTIIDFQYDLTIVLLAKQSKEVEAYTDETISFLKTWMEITLPSVS